MYKKYWIYNEIEYRTELRIERGVQYRIPRSIKSRILYILKNANIEQNID